MAAVTSHEHLANLEAVGKPYTSHNEVNSNGHECRERVEEICKLRQSLESFRTDLDDLFEKRKRHSASLQRLSESCLKRENLVRDLQTDALGEDRRIAVAGDCGSSTPPSPPISAKPSDLEEVPAKQLASVCAKKNRRASINTTPLLIELEACALLVESVVERLRTCDSDDREHLFKELANEFKDIGVRLQNLAADALPRACDQTATGAMDVFQEANALIDRIAVAQHHRWQSVQSFRLCDIGNDKKWRIIQADKLEYVPFLCGEKYSSLSDVAEELEQMLLSGHTNELLDAAQNKGICVVLSKGANAYFVLYRSDKQAVAFTRFGKHNHSLLH